MWETGVVVGSPFAFLDRKAVGVLAMFCLDGVLRMYWVIWYDRTVGINGENRAWLKMVWILDDSLERWLLLMENDVLYTGSEGAKDIRNFLQLAPSIDLPLIYLYEHDLKSKLLKLLHHECCLHCSVSWCFLVQCLLASSDRNWVYYMLLRW